MSLQKEHGTRIIITVLKGLQNSKFSDIYSTSLKLFFRTSNQDFNYEVIFAPPLQFVSFSRKIGRGN